ncbi:MAG: RNA pseudouridine synthase [Stutzerimonas stutzeri]|nr:MAG: RNA pseudouridine synthase [Stutzerimonas stutzeri]
MSDDNNQKSRGPRKGGGAGGRGGGRDGGPGRGGPGGRPPGRGGKPPFRSRDGEERPRRAPAEGAERRSDGERPARRFEKKPFGERPPREGGERPFRDRGSDERRTSRPPRDGDRPRGDRPAGGFGRPSRDGAPSRRPREGGDRPFRERGSEEHRATRPAREGGERPFHQRDGEERRPPRDRGDQPSRSERPFRERSGSGERSARPPRRDDRGEGRGFGGGKRFDSTRGSNPTRSRPDRAHRNAAEIAEAVSVPAAPQEPERIAKVMARAGVASRRDSEALIAEGRVSVNGKVIESPALDVGPNDVVLVDGEPLPARERTRLWFYHKPRGLVTTNHDPEGRPTVFDALPEDLPRVLSVGRLDINTEGLLLLTNDGGLARMLELPETGWLRRYRVRAFGQVNQAQLDTLRGGVTIDGVQYGPVIAQFEREQGSNTWLTVDLREGKNREVKTVLEHLGLQVNRLIRVSFGPFQLGDLPEGEAEEVRSKVLKDQLGTELMAKAGVDFDSPRRDEHRSDERPARGRPAPAGDDRPRRRPREEQAEEARPLRGDKPWTRGVWRDVEAEPQRERKAPPRRGADPKEERQAREATGAVTRVRDKAIADPKGRRVKVERISAKPSDEPREERPARAPRSERPSRAPREESFGRDRGGEAPWRGSGDWADKPPRGKRPPSGGAGAGADDRPARPFRGKPAGDRPSGDRPGGRGPRPGGGGRPPRSGPPRSGGGGRRG